jgi:polyferredoxin
VARVYSKRPIEHPLRIRRSVQAAFLLLNVWIGVQFYFWVRHFETGGQSVYVARPAGVEGWLPIASLMNLKYWVLTGVVPAVHPAGLFLLIAFLAISVVFNKAFCSWLCPIGTLSEWLWQGGRELFGRNLSLPRWADVPLRSLKYVLLALFVYVVAAMTAGEIEAFLTSPYGLVADVKMLDFFRHAGRLTIAICSALVILSVVVKNVWCRYLCPYGALMGLVALASPVRISRDPISCIDCGKCAKACPSLLPVDMRLTVRSPECSACFSCVSACPVKDALELRTPRRGHRVPAAVVAAGVLTIFFAVVGLAKASNHWAGDTPDSLFHELIPNAGRFSHPGR